MIIRFKHQLLLSQNATMVMCVQYHLALVSIGPDSGAIVAAFFVVTQIGGGAHDAATICVSLVVPQPTALGTW